MKDLFRHMPQMPGGGPGGIFRNRQVPADMWHRCAKCHELTYKREWEGNQKVCPRCSYHAPLGTMERIELLLDPGSFQELDHDMRSADPLGFAPEGRESYVAKLEREAAKATVPESCSYGRGSVSSLPVVLAVLDMSFFAGTLGAVMGEKIVRACELAIEERRPLITVSASGGARQQEGVVALLQMAKTAAAVRRLAQVRVPFISILTDPTLAGVTASFAALGDVIIAEPGALIGFAGPRVIEHATGEKLPPTFDTAEFQLSHGMVDLVVPRRDLRDVVARLARLHVDAAARSATRRPAADLVAAG